MPYIFSIMSLMLMGSRRKNVDEYKAEIVCISYEILCHWETSIKKNPSFSYNTKLYWLIASSQCGCGCVFNSSSDIFISFHFIWLLRIRKWFCQWRVLRHFFFLGRQLTDSSYILWKINFRVITLSWNVSFMDRIFVSLFFPELRNLFITWH